MKLKTITLFLFAILLFGIGCEKEDEPEPEPPSITAPALTAIAYDDSIKVIWSDSPEADEEGFQGYLLYSASNISSIPEEADSYAVWAEPQLANEYIITEFDGDSLDPNARYLFALIAVLEYQSVDTLSPMTTAETSPVQMGTARIYELESSEPCAFNFAGDTAITNTETTPDPDFFLMDYPTGANGLAIASPHLAGVAWTSEYEIKALGTGNLDDFPDATDSDLSDRADVTIKVYQIKTGTNYAKIVISQFGGVAPNRYIDFDYKYQNKNNYPHF